MDSVKQRDDENSSEDPQFRSDFWSFLDGGRATTSVLAMISALMLIFLLGKWLIPLVLAAILAVMSWPLRQKVVGLTRGREGVAAFLLVFALVFGVVGPLGFVLFLAGAQAKSFATPERWGELKGQLESWVRDVQGHPIWGRLGVSESDLLGYGRRVVEGAGGWLVDTGLSLGASLLSASVILGLTILCLFYLYASGGRFAHSLRGHLPLRPDAVDRLALVFRRTALAVFKGNFVIGLVQGGLTGLLFAVLGLPSPILFGVVAALASLIPSVGAGLVWLPAALLLFAVGAWGKGLLLLLVGILVISMVDNLLRPLLVGRDAGMHDLMVLLTTMGGISLFGPLGVVFGPLLGALCLAMISLWNEERSSTAGG